jgi:hypothetical protein
MFVSIIQLPHVGLQLTEMFTTLLIGLIVIAGGRAAILMICGKDGSPLFNSQHSGSGRVANILATFKIGALI